MNVGSARARDVRLICHPRCAAVGRKEKEEQGKVEGCRSDERTQHVQCTGEGDAVESRVLSPTPRTTHYHFVVNQARFLPYLPPPPTDGDGAALKEHALLGAHGGLHGAQRACLGRVFDARRGVRGRQRAGRVRLPLRGSTLVQAEPSTGVCVCECLRVVFTSPSF